MNRTTRLSSIPLSVLLAAATSVALLAQTRVDPPSNKYKPEQDVELGRKAAAEAERELPVLRDEIVSGYVETLGQRLTRAIPERFDYPEFEYSFTTVNLKEINAFALPGGPMFVNRGMIEAAHEEGEVAGVMAHELAHVLLRHGTAQMTKAQGFQIGAIAGAIAGAIIGGNAGAVVSEGSRFGLGAYFLKYSREYEKQADILGAQLMARAGYDPRDLATMFETISKQGGAGGPEWLSSHPNPGDRSAYIQQEAAQLRVENPIGSSGEFDRVQARLGGMAPALTSAEAARRAPSAPDTGASAPIGGNVAPPSSQYRTVRGGDVFQASVPANWRELSSETAVKFVPEGGYGRVGRQTVFTHGVEFGMARTGTRDLRAATNALLDGFARTNTRLEATSDYQQGRLGGRPSLTTALRNVSDATQRTESITVTTAFLDDGTLFYCLTIAPADEAARYRDAFARVVRSVNFTR
jgi:Zn-dependent protease with chaperone function